MWRLARPPQARRPSPQRHRSRPDLEIVAPALLECRRAATERLADPVTYDVFLDLRGLACPMPLIRTRQALMVVEAGATICVLATDPAAKADFESFCEATGHRLSCERRDDVLVLVVEKA